MPDTAADSTIDNAPLSANDRLLCRLWLALIDGLSDGGADLSTAWRMADAINAHWRACVARNYEEGLREGREAAAVEAARRHRRKQLERELITMQFGVTH
jgi:hypothetical protein